MVAVLASIEQKSLFDSLSVITMKEYSTPTIEGDIEAILTPKSMKKYKQIYQKDQGSAPVGVYQTHGLLQR